MKSLGKVVKVVYSHSTLSLASKAQHGVFRALDATAYLTDCE